MNFEVTKGQSKSQATILLEEFNWNTEQTRVLTEIEKHGSIVYNKVTLDILFGSNFNPMYFDTETTYPMALKCMIHYNKAGQKIIRKKDTAFTPLF